MIISLQCHTSLISLMRVYLLAKKTLDDWLESFMNLRFSRNSSLPRPSGSVGTNIQLFFYSSNN